MVYLGIDFGLKKVGLAISYSGKQATAVGVFSLQEVNQVLTNLIEKENIDKIVIGLPEGKLAKEIQNFAQKLERTSGLEVELVDETLSSKEALTALVASGTSRKKRKKKLDAYAACLILENYLARTI